MVSRFLFSGLLMLWLAGRAAADGGDDFANNLASDLGPILALFGERVVMQFMSQAMGIADCILLAVAPIGAITTVVSAIRVAGPAWLKSFIGRARENLSAAEVEVMSSTSKETCELWNGHSVVRCPGSADIYQFICLIPNKHKVSTLSNKRLNIRYKTLKDIEKEAEKTTKRDNIEDAEKPKEEIYVTEVYEKVSEKPILLQKTKKTGPKYTWQCFRNGIRPYLDKLKRIYPPLPQTTKRTRPDLESQDGPSTGNLTGSSDSTTSTIPAPSNIASAKDPEDGEEVEIVVVMDNLDDSAPNLLLNCHDRVGRSEIYLAAAVGVILQLGAVVYFGVITYHKPIQDRFLKDDRSVVKYAFPCAAVGTILLVVGLFICSWVVGESTKETYYEAQDHQVYVVWLQKHHTVSDQEFKPYAIYPTSKREYITLSRRNIKHRSQEIRGLFQVILKRLFENSTFNPFQIISNSLFKDQTISQDEDAKGEAEKKIYDHNKSAEEPLYWPSKFITFLGALISLTGFISQFIGMRGLNWTASIVQLGITIVVTILRVIVRRGLGKPPARISLNPRFELDWFVLSFGNLNTAPWANVDGESNKSVNQNDEPRDERSSKWKICTGGQQTYLPLMELDKRSGQHTNDSEPHKIMIVRKQLGILSRWNSPVLEEADRLSRAIEAVAHAFLSGQSEATYEWSIPAIYTANKSTESVKDKIYITLYKDDERWRVDEAEIEAILSLWLYSISSTKLAKTSRRRSFRLYGSTKSEERLIRDLEWWMPENIPKILKYTEDEITEFTKEGTECMAVGFKSEYDGIGESINTVAQNDSNEEYLVLECQDKQKRLFSRDLLFSFIRAVAKMPEVCITSASSAYPLPYNKMTKGWRQMKLRNDAISDLARRLEKIGFGTLSDIYIDLIIPLSLEQKLTNVKNVITEATRQAHEYERSRQWKKLVDTCLCLLDLALQFDLEREPSGPLAIAVCLGFLYRLRHEDSLQKSERRREEELTTQLQQLEKEFTNEKIKNSIYFSALPPDEGKHFAVSLRMLAGSEYNSKTSFPDSFQIAAEHLKVMQESELEQILHIQDFKALEKIDAFGWSPLHYATNLPLRSILIDDDNQKAGDLSNLRDLMGWTPLQHACLCGNEKVVSMLLEHGTPIEIAGKDGITPMHCAVQGGNVEIIKDLIKWIKLRRQKHTRKSVAHVDRNERYPIHWAAVEGNIDMVRQMKDDISLTDRFGWTPLHLAAIYGHKSLLQFITKDYAATINIDAGDNEARTPLHLAVENESIAAVQILLNAGAKINTTAKNGSTPLHEAMNNNQLHIVRKLLNKEANLEALDMEGRSPFYLAVENESIAAVQMLLDAGAKVNTAAKDGSTPLHVAVKHKQILEMLLKHDADKEAIDMEGRTPLYLAVEDGVHDIINLLINNGAHVKTAAKDGRTPLHVALSRGQDGLDVAKFLLRAGADANTKAQDGATVLHIAAQCGSLFGITNMLTDMKVWLDVDVTDEYGQTPLLIAIYEADWKAAKLLLNMNASIDADQRDGYKPLLGAVIGENEDILQQLLELGADANDADEDGYSALHLAVLDGKRTIIRMLLDAGADIDAIDTLRNETPLHIAVRKGYGEIVQTLLDSGATTISLNSRGFSPLQHALYRGDFPMVQRLVEHDKTANIKAALQKNEKGDTPLHTLATCEKDEDAKCKMLDELLSISPKVEINAENNEGNTPLDSALSEASAHRLFITKMLEKGAKPGSEDARKLLEDWKSKD